MIGPAEIATADDGKRIVLYPLELSMRDYFAAAALVLSGVAAARRADIGDVPADGMIQATAAIAYDLADAMLAERAK